MDNFETLSDSEMIRFFATDESTDEDGRLIKQSLARIIVAMKNKGIDCGWFIWWNDESFGLTNANDYKHLGRIHDYAIRYSNEIINGQ